MSDNVVQFSNKLSSTSIESITSPGRYADGDGLYLQVAPGGSKQWLLRYMIKGKARQMGLGSVKRFTLAEARDRAQECQRQLARGVDPIEARRLKDKGEPSRMPQKILRRRDMKAVTGYTIGHLYELIAAGEFPKPIPLGPRAVGWLESEVAEWQARCIAERDSGARPRMLPPKARRQVAP